MSSEKQNRATVWVWIAMVGLGLTGWALLRSADFEAPREDSQEMDQLIHARSIETGRLLDAKEKRVLEEALEDQELLFQEGRRQGLLETDPVVRRRIVQRVLEQTEAGIARPTEEALVYYYNANAERYARPSQIRFSQLFFPSSRFNEEEVKERAKAINNIETFSAALASWPHKARAHQNDMFYTQRRLESLYGPTFTEDAMSAPEGEVAGPFASSIGWSLIHITGRKAVQPLSFSTVRKRVESEWRESQRIEHTQALLKRLRKKNGNKPTPKAVR